MSSDFEPLLDVLKQDVWFKGLPADLQAALLGLATLKHFKAGARLFSKGDPTSGLYALLDGRISVMNQIEPGLDGALTMLQPPAWFGEVGLFDGLCRTHNVTAASDCAVLFFAHGPLVRLLDAHPHYWKCFSLLLTHKLRLTFLALDELAKAPVEMRLARRLMMLSIGLNGDEAARELIEVQQEHLAQMMGMSRASINPLLRRLEDEGTICLAYGKITITNMDALKQLAGYDRFAMTLRDSQQGR